MDMLQTSVSANQPMNSTRQNSGLGKMIFITGTDTNVGKTVVTGLLLARLRQTGQNVVAMKPFSAGSLADARLYNRLQDNCLPMDLIAPFRAKEPVAPLVSMRNHVQRVGLKRVVRRILAVKDRCEVLLVEGVGGLLVPLGEGFAVLDIIQALACPVVVVGRNRLGTLNHVMLTVSMLQDKAVNRVKVVLTEGMRKDESSDSNPKILRELLSPIEVLCLPYLGQSPLGAKSIKNNLRKIKKTLARLTEFE